MSIDWSTFDGFKRPTKVRSWAGVAKWIERVEKRSGPERDALARLRKSWDEVLADLGGDPSARDWTSFRPLRRDREEDWSDWLAHLVEDSRTGRFAWVLLGKFEPGTRQSDYVESVAHREVSHEGYRADLIIKWTDATYSHVEVKVGDPDLAKTLATAKKMEMRFRHARRRSDSVLLMPWQSEAWNVECKRQPEMRERVHELTWIDVACALRDALRHGKNESTHWRVWAHTFCGAVEQDLLGIRFGVKPDMWAHSLTLGTLGTAATLFALDGES